MIASVLLLVPLFAQGARAAATTFQGPGASGHVYSLGQYQGALVAAGEFTSIGGIAASRIARWDGVSWSTFGSAPLDGVRGPRFARVFDTVEHNGKLYVAGVFLRAGGTAVSNVACWQESTLSWSSLAGGMDGWVLSLAVYDDGSGPAVYAGGDFQHAGGVPARNLAKWNEILQAWSPVGLGTDGPVNTLLPATFEGSDRLFIGGDFATAGGAPALNVAQLTGSLAGPLANLPGNGVDGVVFALSIFDDGGGPALFVGGDFANAGNAAAGRVARWRGGAWTALGSGVGVTAAAAHEDVRTMVVYDDGSGPALVVGGQFTRAGDVSIAPASPVSPVNEHGDSALGAGNTLVGSWDGSAWSGVGLNMNDTVFDMVVHGGALCAAGRFTSADNASPGRIARFSSLTGEWSELGSGGLGTSHAVRALIAFDGGGGPRLHVGGDFVTAGDQAIRRIARWDEGSSSWTALGGGLDGPVLALASGPGTLYAGGRFTEAGGVAASRVAAWHAAGSTWLALGSGVDDTVHALAVHDQGDGAKLYAGGAFTVAGGVGAEHVARWNGAAWAPLPGGGLDDTVRALVGFQGDLIAGGDFAASGERSVSGVARWDGGAWLSMGTGFDGEVHALHVHAGDLYAGGSFSKAGAASVRNIARWDGSTWLAVGLGTDGPVVALSGHPGSGVLFAGGRFTSAGGVAASNLAGWSGTAWSEVGGGSDDWVRALLRLGPRLYAGGGFGSVGGAPSSHLVGLPAL